MASLGGRGRYQDMTLEQLQAWEKTIISEIRDFNKEITNMKQRSQFKVGHVQLPLMILFTLDRLRKP